MNQPSHLYCSMCGARHQSKENINPPTTFLVEGHHAKICEECVVLCSDLILEARANGKMATLIQSNVWDKLEAAHMMKNALRQFMTALTPSERTIANAAASNALEAWNNVHRTITANTERQAS